MLAGAGLGASAYLVMWLKTGAIVPINLSYYLTPLPLRKHLSFIGFIGFYLADFVQKWPAVEYHLPLWPTAALMVAVPIFAIIGARAGLDHRRTVTAYLIGLAVLFFTHLGFGWQSFRTIGDITIAQTRYYGVLWPGLALGGALAIGWMRRRHRTGLAALAIYLVPTMLIGPLLALG